MADGGREKEERMVESLDTVANVQTHESGRLLTPEEASFLQQFLLESEPVVVVGRDDGKKDSKKKQDSK